MKYIYWTLGIIISFLVLGVLILNNPINRMSLHYVFMNYYYFHEGDIEGAFKYASRWNDKLDKSIIMGVIYHETGNVSALCNYNYDSLVKREFEAICLASDFKYEEIINRYPDTQLYYFALAYKESSSIEEDEFFPWLSGKKLTSKEGAVLYIKKFGIEKINNYCDYFRVRLVECEVVKSIYSDDLVDFSGFPYAERLMAIQYNYYLTGKYFVPQSSVYQFLGCNIEYYECVIITAISKLFKNNLSDYERLYFKAVSMWPDSADNDYLLLEKYIFFCDKEGFDKIVKEKNIEATYFDWADVEKCGTSE